MVHRPNARMEMESAPRAPQARCARAPVQLATGGGRQAWQAGAAGEGRAVLGWKGGGGGG